MYSFPANLFYCNCARFQLANTSLCVRQNPRGSSRPVFGYFIWEKFSALYTSPSQHLYIIETEPSFYKKSYSLLSWCISKISFVMSTVIIGAGIIGTSTAYYLSQISKNQIHLVEASPQLFASASGYAAGFLARDWFTPSLSALGELSFDLHKQLAEENNGHVKWGYSRSTGTSLAETVGKNGADWLMEGVSRSTAAARTSKSSGNRPAWMTPGDDLDVMSDGSTTAQW